VVTQFPDERVFKCLSTDTKPLKASGVRNGDKLIEMNTSKIYYFNTDADAWVEFTQRVTSV
jgi:hypothetical protein